MTVDSDFLSRPGVIGGLFTLLGVAIAFCFLWCSSRGRQEKRETILFFAVLLLLLTGHHFVPTFTQDVSVEIISSLVSGVLITAASLFYSRRRQQRRSASRND